MLPYFSVKKFHGCHLLRIRRGGTLCRETPAPLPDGAEPVHRRRPSPAILMNHSPRVEFGPFKVYPLTSSLPSKTIFFSPFHLAKPGLKQQEKISQDFSSISNSEQRKWSWGWGMNLYCRPLKSWYALEGEL